MHERRWKLVLLCGSHALVLDVAALSARDVTAAAAAAAAAGTLQCNADAIDKILDINIKAALLLVQAAAPHMKRGGRIILISSVTAYQ
jgi:NAD(P)-dependent dehydrogenase (short-subunit alcohol dehydrogenase family)